MEYKLTTEQASANNDLQKMDTLDALQFERGTQRHPKGRRHLYVIK